ncbi:MAG: hypothetical protein MI923_10375 [Phycisphaerales bacterium]|nr:hypothetical protein [Phycisphaerales bacterium]
MSVRSGQAKINHALKELFHDWYNVQSVWRDEMGRKFEEKHLMPIKLRIRAADKTMSHMAALLVKVRRDCGDDYE